MTDRAKQVAALLAETVAVWMKDEADGNLPKRAARPLSDKERAAGVKFGLIGADLEAAEVELADVIARLREGIGLGLAAVLFGEGDELNAPALMARFNIAAASLPPAIAAQIRDATEQIAEISERIERGGAERVDGEAEHQGVKSSRGAPKPYPRDRWVVAASVAAMAAWERVVTVIRRDVVSPKKIAAVATFSRPDFASTITEINLDGAVDLARQTVLQAHRTGRDRAASAYNIEACFASEILDGNTCRECREIDLVDFETFEDGRAAYPFGGYKACAGGLRCRGTLVFVLSEDGEIPPPPPPWEPDEWATLDDVIPQ